MAYETIPWKKPSRISRDFTPLAFYQQNGEFSEGQ